MTDRQINSWKLFAFSCAIIIIIAGTLQFKYNCDSTSTIHPCFKETKHHTKQKDNDKIGSRSYWLAKDQTFSFDFHKLSQLFFDNQAILLIQAIQIFALGLLVIPQQKSNRMLFKPFILWVIFFPSLVNGTYVSTQAIYIGTQNNEAKSVIKTSDGGYLFVGGTSEGTNLGTNIQLTKVDSTFGVVSFQYVGYDVHDDPKKIARTSTGGSVVIGDSYYSPTKICIFLFDSNNALVWSGLFGGSSQAFGYDAVGLSSGNMLFVGSSVSTITNRPEAWIFCLDSNKNQVFSQKITGYYNSEFYALALMNNGNIILGGRVAITNTLGMSYMVKTDSSATVLWQKMYTSTVYDNYFWSVAIGPDSNIFACGTGQEKFYVFMADSDGNQLWNKYYVSVLTHDSCYSVAVVPDGNYTAVGKTYVPEEFFDNGWIMEFSYDGKLLFQYSFGGIIEDVFFAIVTESDSGYTAVGKTYSFPTYDSKLRTMIKGDYFICDTGYYNSSGVCTKCLAGSYSSIRGVYECSPCGIGHYQNLKGQSSCLACPAGTYQTSTSQSSCINCGIGTYNANTGSTDSTACIVCEDGYYQDTAGGATCKTCAANFNPNLLKTACLYKGIFTTEALFTSSAFKTNCFDALVNLVIPYTQNCRSTYRSLCCLGSSILAAGPICNYGLEISSSSSLYNKYCSACPFLDQTRCPVQGVCWDDSLFVDNSYNPYSSFSEACIESIKSYCGEKLQINENNGECYMFKTYCSSPTITSCSYGSSFTSFTIVSSQKLSTEAIKNDIFSGGMAGSIVSKKSETELSVDISEMDYPPTSFSFKYRGLTTFCEVGFSESVTHSITAPTLALETVSLTSSSPVANKCANLLFSSTVTKPYSWAVKYSWNVQYTTTATPTALSQLVSATTTATLTIDTIYLIEGQTFQVSLTITNPFLQTVTSNVLSYPVQTISGVNYACSPCKFTDRSKCTNLDSICWEDSSVYLPSYPLLFTQKCLEAVAPECYAIWSTNGLADPQCLIFVPYIDYSKMWVKPNVVSCLYVVDGILKLRITFDTEVKTTALSTCNAIFAEETFLLLGSNPQCIWNSTKIVDVVYSGTNNLVSALKIRKDSIYYNYKYAINPSDSVTLTPIQPDISGTISINAPSFSSSCKTLILTAVSSINGIFEYSYTWSLSYTVQSTLIQSNFALLATQNKKIITVTSDNLLSNSDLHVVLTAHVSILNVNIIAEKTISIASMVPDVQFSSSELYELNLIGDKTNNLGLVIDSDPCNSGNNIDTRISFIVHSGYVLTQISTRNEEEIDIENTLSKNFQKYNILPANVKSGFKYNRYYNLTVCACFTGNEKNVCISKIIGIYKSPISVYIKEMPSFVQIPSSVIFNGVNSLIPLETDENVQFKWQCISCYSFMSNSECNCPPFLDSEAASRLFYKNSSKFSDFCQYKIRLSVTSQSGLFQRTESSDAMFITTSNPVSMVEGKINFEGKNDIYFSFNVNYKGKDSDLTLAWSLVEVSNSSPNNTFKYSKLNTFVYNFFAQKGVTLNSLCKSNDQEIPDSLKPSEITSNKNRVMGIKKEGLISESSYKYAVLIQDPSVLSAMIISIQAPKFPVARNLSVTPNSGIALETKFLLSYPISSGISDSNEVVKILAVSCNDAEKLVHSIVGHSTIFEGVLSSGKSECGYQVTLILRVMLGKVHIDQNVTVIVKPYSSVIPNAISKLLSKSQANNSYTNTLSTLSSVTLTSISQESEQTKSNIKKSYDVLSDMDNKATGVYSQLDESSRLHFLNFSFNILENILTQNTIENLNLTLQNLIEKKIDDYAYRLDKETKSDNDITAAIQALSASAYLKKQRGGCQSYSDIGNIIEKLREMKLKDLQPDGLPYEVLSTMISLKMKKQYAIDFNNSQEISNIVVDDQGKPTGSPSSNSKQTKKTKVSLPNNLTQRVVDCMPFVKAYNTTFMISTSMISLKMNPYENVKTNSYVLYNSITKLSYNTAWIKASVIPLIYRDLRRHKFDNIIDINAQYTDLIQLTFNGSSIEKNAVTTDYKEEVQIGKLNNSDNVVYNQPYTSTEESRQNNILIPFYKEKDYWTNRDCNLTDVTNTEIITTSDSIGSSKGFSVNHAVEIVTDVFKDTITVLKSGNYDMLISFENFNELTITNYVILIVCLLIFFGTIITVFILYIKDKKAIILQKFKTLEYLVQTHELPPPEGIIASIFSFFRMIKKKGLKAFSLESNNVVVPENSPVSNRAQVKSFSKEINNAEVQENSPSSSRKEEDKTNGYTVFNEEEKQTLENLFNMYKEKRVMFPENELVEILREEFDSCDPLSRRTKDYIQDTMLGYSGLFLILLQQELASALFMVDLRIVRPIKFLIFGLILFSDLAVSGLFFSSNQSSEGTGKLVSMAVIYSIATIIILIPVKIVVGFLLAGYDLKEEMTREEITSQEKKSALLRKIGIAVGGVLFTIVIFAIIMFSVNFESTSLSIWLWTFGATVVADNTLLYLSKCGLQLLYAKILEKIISKNCMRGCVENLMNFILEFLVKIIY